MTSAGSRKKVVLVDGSALVFRAFFAIPSNLVTTKGVHTNAVFGFATMFRKMFTGRKPELGAVVFDSPVKTFREERFPQYKAQRPELPGELSEQLPWISTLVDTNRFTRLRVDGWEADDVIGTLTREAVEAGMEVVIVSSDKDFAQLIGEHVRMHDTLRDVVYDAELVFKKWGVRPEQMVDLLALMGDSVDGIPGVAGIGQKGAANLLAEHGSLDGILAALDAGLLKGRVKTALEAGRASAILSRDLATIDTAVPLPVRIDALAIPAPDPEALNALYRELEFNSLITGAIAAAGPGGTAGVSAAREEVAIPKDAAEASALVDALMAAGGPIAVVPLVERPSAITGAWVGLALAREAGKGAYLPLAMPGVDAVARRVLEDPAVPKIAHDWKELWQIARRSGIAPRGVDMDTMLASYLVEPTKLIPHRLDQLAREFLQRALRPLKELVGSGQKEIAVGAIPLADAAAFAVHLACAVREVADPLLAKLESMGLRDLLAIHEMPLAPVLGKMELDGIKVDPENLRRCGEEFAETLRGLEGKIHAAAGRAFNIGSTKQLSTVLFEELKLPVIKRNKTGYSTDSEVLERLAPKHEIAALIVEHRRIAKLINTYTDVLQAAVDPRDGRVHATFQQTAGASGRIIATDPDLQRTPIKTPEGKRIREAFVPEPGNALISADWSQIELRVLAHLSRDPLLVDSFTRGVDVHRRTAGQLFHVDPAEVTPLQRNVGKTINFATIYGQGATALGQILGIPRKEAAAYIDGYFAAYAGVRAWLDRTIAEANETGFVTTLLGRKRWIPELRSRNEMDRQTGERIAANTPIQGSAADLCKLAMRIIAARLEEERMKTRMLVQIHDELLFEAPDAEVEKASAIVREGMEHAHPLSVPLVVELGVGGSWAAAH